MKDPHTPPQNTLHVNRWSELPHTTDQAQYQINSGDDQHIFTARKKTRQVLEALLKQPVASASKCRISDRVLLLRRDCGLEIEMTLYRGSDGSGGENFGVYELKSNVERVDDLEGVK